MRVEGVGGAVLVYALLLDVETERATTQMGAKTTTNHEVPGAERERQCDTALEGLGRHGGYGRLWANVFPSPALP